MSESKKMEKTEKEGRKIKGKEGKRGKMRRISGKTRERRDSLRKTGGKNQ